MKGKIIVIIIVILILGVLGLSLFFKYFPKTAYEKALNDCEKLIEEESESFEVDICYQQLAINEGDESLCENINTASSKDSCYEGVAIKTKNYNLCDNIQNSDSKKNSCFINTAKSNKDITLCEKVINLGSLGSEADFKDKCYYGVSLIIGGKENCDKISNVRLREDCYWAVAVLEKKPVLCEKMSDEYPYKDKCLNLESPYVKIGEEAYQEHLQTWGIEN